MPIETSTFAGVDPMKETTPKSAGCTLHPQSFAGGLVPKMAGTKQMQHMSMKSHDCKYAIHARHNLSWSS